MNQRWRLQMALVPFHVRQAAKRWARAFRYATGRMTEQDADWIAVECYHARGLYPLEYLSVESVLEAARDRYGDHPALEDLTRRAARRVWNKWSGSDSSTDASESWAMDLIGDYAEQDGIHLEDSWEDAAELEEA